jgi:prepilin-type processing-associated H-X9-DG protein
LAAILFPVFARARENARRASCMSNLKQLALGTMQYTQDYDERLPGSADDSDDGTAGPQNPNKPENYWFGKLQPYLKSTQIFLCPSDVPYSSTYNPAGKTFESYTVGSWWCNTVSYGWNYNGLTLAASPLGNLYTYGGLSLAAVDNTSEVVMMADNGGKATNIPHYVISCREGTPSDDTKTSAPTAIHLDGANFAFVDGHVKWNKIPGTYNSNATCNNAALLKQYWNY